MEQWLPVVGFEGLYEVSDLGRVKVLARRLNTWFGGRSMPEQMLHAKPKGSGYPGVSLSDAATGRKSKHVSVHTLVLEAFVGHAPAGMECLHGDDNRLNAALKNLRWGTHKENGMEMKTRGRAATGHRHGRASLSEELERWICESNQGSFLLANLLGVTPKVIYRARATAR